MGKYQSYKPSGVEWIGEIPENWSSGKMKYVLSNNDGGVWGEDLEDEEEGTLVVRSTEITIDGNWDLSQILKRKLTKNEVSKCKLFEGDIVITKSSGSPQHIGKSVIVSKEIEDLNCCYSNFVQRIRFKNYNPRLYHYILNSEIVREQFKYLTTSSTGLGNLNGTSLNDVLLPFIPISEQDQIVQFLDEKTEFIDKLISIKERKITLLKEQRTSLINQVVTKGLNPNVKMKDSGVEWIGEIPEHWVVTKFNRYVFFQEGPGLRTFQFTDEGTKVICVTNITENGIDFTYKKFISNEEYLEKYQHFTVQKGDLLLSSSGNSWGKVSEYLEDEKVILNTSTIRLNTLDSNRMFKTFIKYILKSEFVRTQLDILMTGSCQPNFGPTHLNQLIIPVPPLEEQFEIISNIEKHDFEFQNLVQFEQGKIDLLKEYRQSLISEVVTGKIKVTTDE